MIMMMMMTMMNPGRLIKELNQWGTSGTPAGLFFFFRGRGVSKACELADAYCGTGETKKVPKKTIKSKKNKEKKSLTSKKKEQKTKKRKKMTKRLKQKEKSKKKRKNKQNKKDKKKKKSILRGALTYPDPSQIQARSTLTHPRSTQIHMPDPPRSIPDPP